MKAREPKMEQNGEKSRSIESAEQSEKRLKEELTDQDQSLSVDFSMFFQNLKYDTPIAPKSAIAH